MTWQTRLPKSNSYTLQMLYMATMQACDSVSCLHIAEVQKLFYFCGAIQRSSYSWRSFLLQTITWTIYRLKFTLQKAKVDWVWALQEGTMEVIRVWLVANYNLVATFLSHWIMCNIS